ncbi:uncharacterized protein LOC111890403 [Lactuca sativa]|uniref:Uncharacterized protein n=1 Tax=Lactuca sativa TaxID=4236 RepID=A0A9R1V300_LACSA|nr:uncharacterized protein LOC111890403 [Lactuca sativa]KAJ0197355.1 hypothetical protein LSAT_V11C700356320 [Lactuca sativa]
MEKTPHSFPEPSVKGIMQRILLDLNQLPLDISEEPKNDVPPPLRFSIDLTFHNEDMEVLKKKYKVLTASSFVSRDYLKNLGFEDGCATMMHIRNKKVKMPRNSNHALARSLFKELTKKNEGEDLMVSLYEPIEGNKNKKKGKDQVAHRLAAKSLLKEFVLQSKDRYSVIRKKRKKKVRFDCGPLDGIWKKKLPPKKRRGIVIFDKEYNA